MKRVYGISVLCLVAALMFSACGSSGGGGNAGVASYTVGGTVSGLTGTVVLQNNESDDLTITADGSFTFATKVADGGEYSVTVLTQPETQTCTASSNTGTISDADVTDVSVTCEQTYTIGGAVTGLEGSVVLRNNGDELTVTSNGNFTFATPLLSGATYSIAVKTKPTYQRCGITNGSGTVANANVANVNVACAINPDKLTASDGLAEDRYGSSVSLSADGATIVVGAVMADVIVSSTTNTDQGAVYVYQKDGSVWQETKLLASDGAADEGFGSTAVSADGKTIVAGVNGYFVGQRKAYIYEWSGSAWTETNLVPSDGALNDGFGESVAVSSDGKTIAATAVRYNSYQGAVYIYKKNGASWVGTKLLASDGAVEMNFGEDASLSADGTMLAVGSAPYPTGTGHVYVYSWDGSTWVEQQKITSSDGAADDYFGKRVRMASDGGTIVVGVEYATIGANINQGAAYVYTKSGNIWNETKIIASDGAANDYFGQAVSVSSDGRKIVVGAFGENNGQGAVYVYSWNGGAWTEKKLTATDGASGDFFGSSVAISGDGSMVAAGASADDISANVDQGSVYVY